MSQFQPPAEYYTYEAPPLEPRHSGPGIASLIIACATGLLEFIAVIAAAVMTANSGGEVDENDPAAIVLGLIMCGGLAMLIVGLVLGIVGLVQRDRKRLFAILGIILNGLVLIILIGLVIIGLLMG